MFRTSPSQWRNLLALRVKLPRSRTALHRLVQPSRVHPRISPANWIKPGNLPVSSRARVSRVLSLQCLISLALIRTLLILVTALGAFCWLSSSSQRCTSRRIHLVELVFLPGSTARFILEGYRWTTLPLPRLPLTLLLLQVRPFESMCCRIQYHHSCNLTETNENPNTSSVHEKPPVGFGKFYVSTLYEGAILTDFQRRSRKPSTVP